MSYYPTLREDVERAKAILAEGKPDEASLAALPATIRNERGGTIYGKDIYAAYKLLESFVEVIEALDVKVCELALRHQLRTQQLKDYFAQRTRPAQCQHGHLDTSPNECAECLAEEAAHADIGDAPPECVCRRPGCGHPASEHDGHGGCKLCQRLNCWS